MLRFYCEECGTTLRVPEDQVGNQEKCSRCGASLRLLGPESGVFETAPLPAAQAAAAIVPPSRPADKRLLVIEDDCHIQDAMTQVLEWEGYTVAWARDGQAALDYLHTAERPHLIVLDLMMHGKNGWEFRQEQRQDPALASIPVILVSAVENLPQEAVNLGAAAYLPKPIELNELLTTIQRYC